MLADSDYCISEPPPTHTHSLAGSWVVGRRVGSVVPSWRVRFPTALYKASGLRKAAYNPKRGDARAALFDSQLYQLAKAAMTKCLRLGGLKAQMYFFTVLEARNQSSRCPQVWFPMRLLFSACS